MSKIVIVFELPNMTEAQYDAIMTELNVANATHQAERPSHVAFQKGTSWCVIDVWNSAEAFMNFGQTTLFDIFARLGIEPPQPAIYPAHNYLGN